MSRLTNLYSSITSAPGYTLMRGLARFAKVRTVVSGLREVAHAGRYDRYIKELEARASSSEFSSIDVKSFVDQLRTDGVAFGLKLGPQKVAEILRWASDNSCYADRDPALGFKFKDHGATDEVLGKPVLLAQYFNTIENCPAINELANDPVLNLIAALYLKSIPNLVGANLWWTFPVKASDAERDKYAHVFHRDVDDFKFFKFFFYLTDVSEGEGAHVAVVGSHKMPPKLKRSDSWLIRRYSDTEIESCYPATAIKEICGQAGVGFAENTLCIHKGRTPKSEPRLLLQLQFALFDYGVMNDRRDVGSLEQLRLN